MNSVHHRYIISVSGISIEILHRYTMFAKHSQRFIVAQTHRRHLRRSTNGFSSSSGSSSTPVIINNMSHIHFGKKRKRTCCNSKLRMRLATKQIAMCGWLWILATMMIFVSSHQHSHQHSHDSRENKILAPEPEVLQPYRLEDKIQDSPDSFRLKFALPEGRQYLGNDPILPTCIKIEYKPSDDSIDVPAVNKSYSPISHPSAGYFELLVKAYPYEPGTRGGVGAYLCNLNKGDSIMAALKAPRRMHGAPTILDRNWSHLGFIAGGTGIAPLLQLIYIVLDDADSNNSIIKVLVIDRLEEDILMKDTLDQLARDYPDRFSVTYSLTGVSVEEEAGTGTGTDGSIYERGRGSIEMAKRALPPPTHSLSAGEQTMIFVCGRDGFVETWAGSVGRAPPSADGAKGNKIQGPLMGLLADAGYDASEVFKY